MLYYQLGSKLSVIWFIRKPRPDFTALHDNLVEHMEDVMKSYTTDKSDWNSYPKDLKYMKFINRAFFYRYGQKYGYMIESDTGKIVKEIGKR